MPDRDQLGTDPVAAAQQESEARGIQKILAPAGTHEPVILARAGEPQKSLAMVMCERIANCARWVVALDRRLRVVEGTAAQAGRIVDLESRLADAERRIRELEVDQRAGARRRILLPGE